MYVNVDADVDTDSTSLPAPYSCQPCVTAACKCRQYIIVYTDLIIASFYSIRPTAMVVIIVKGVMGMIGSDRKK